MEDGLCTSHGVCELYSCRDGEANASESDQDCGGPDCERRCDPGDECRENSDCDSNVCQSGKCVTGDCDPTSGPCGTADCLCANGRDCMKHDDCASGNCAGGTCGEGMRVFSRNDAAGAADSPTPAILQAFLVRNDSPTDVPLGQISLRYYFTNDGLGESQARCDASRVVEPNACVGVTAPVFGQTPPTMFADAYAEVRFPDGNVLGAGSQTSEIPIVIEPPAGGLYTQRGDHSFEPSESFVANANVTLYRRGVLIWGREP